MPVRFCHHCGNTHPMNVRRCPRLPRRGGQAYWARRQSVLTRDGRVCAYCRGHANSVDHVVPLAQGGNDSEANMVACCSSCNERKGNRTPAQWKAAA